MSAARPFRGLAPHAVLLVLLLFEGALALERHRGAEELERAWASGPPRERLAALQVLTSRGEPPPTRFGRSFVQEVLATEEPPVLEAVFANEICKFEPPALQSDVLRDIPLDRVDLLWRAFVLLKHKVGGPVVGAGKRMKLQDLEWFLEAADPDRTLPADRIVQYVRDQATAYRQQREALEALRGSAAGYEED